MAFKTSSKQKLSTSSAGFSTTIGVSTGGGTGPTITGVYITDSSYVNLDDTAVSTSGGYIKLIGTGFVTGCIAYINGVAATTTFVSSTEIRAVVPALASGTYSLMMFNSAGSGAIWATGLTASGFPTVTTSAYSNSGNVLNIQLLASGDGTLTYSLQNGSTLPTGVTLSSSGVLSGTATAITSATVVSFTILVNDAQQQTSQQAITLSLTFGDDYFKNTVLAIQANTTPFLSDASSNNVVLTPAGSVKADQFNPYQGEGYYSGYFATASDYITTTPITMSATAFTVECWINTTNKTAYAGICKNGAAAEWSVSDIYIIGLDSSGNSIWIYDAQSSGGVSLNGTTTVTDGNWHHIAFVYNGTDYKLYIDGAINATTVKPAMAQTARVHNIGADIKSARPWIGYISNFRIINGVALYTEAFTPPTQPLTTTETAVTYTAPSTVDYLVVAGGGGGSYLIGGGGGAGGMVTGTGLTITPNSSLTVTVGAGGTGATTQISGVNGKNSVFSNTDIVTYSGVFNGTSYIRKAGAGVLATAGGDLTIETWIYSNTSSITGLYDGGPGQASIIRNITANKFGWQGNDAGGADITGKFPVSTWFHLAITYSNSGSVVKAYINGALAATGSAGAYGIGTNFDIGGVNSSGSFNGYLSNFRVTNRLVYTANFIPPTEPLSVVDNTSYLVFKNATIIDNSTNSFAITNTSVTVSSTVTPPMGIVAFGGGGGGAWSAGAGLPGGSGGGGSGSESGGGLGGNNSGSQGNAGGAGAGARLAGGGGGAGTIGGTAGATALYAGKGGDGLSSSITGTSTYYAGGGGGGSETTYANNYPGAGGIGGGGRGGGITAANVNGSHGISNTGGGGGGGGNVSGSTSGSGGNGGSGVVIIRYVDTASPAVTTGSPEITVSGGYRIYKFTKSGTIKFRNTSSPAVTAAQTSVLVCQSNRFKNNNSTASAITIAGSPKIAQAIPYVLPTNTYGSGYFNGTTDYITTPGNSVFALGTGDFTIEAWIYTNSINTATFDRVCATSDYTGAGFDWSLSSNSSALFLAGTSYSIGLLINKTWQHIAYTRSGSIIRGFLNGNMSSYTTGASQNITSVTELKIGTGYSGTMFNGQMSDLRIIKGAVPASYQTSSTTTGTQIFTPPTQPLTAVSGTSLLTLQTKSAHNNNTYQDTSGFNNLITATGAPSQGTFSPFSPAGWSTSFNGSTDAIEFPSNYNLSSGASAVTCTIEAWFNTATPATDQTIFAKYTSGTDGVRLGLNASKLTTYLNGNTINITGTTTLLANTWYHVALSGSVGNWKVFLNGVQDGPTFTGSVSLGANAVNQIGRASNVVYFNGNISNVRVTTGTALYTSNFTTPTTALTAVTGTVLLTCQDNRFKDNSVNASVLTIVGTPKIQALSPFKPSTVYDPVVHGGSSYSPTTSDYLSTSLASNQAFGTGDFTVECWVYAVATAHNLIMPATGTTSWGLLTFGSQLYWQQNGANLFQAGSILLNTWSHVAVSRASGVIKAFINGIQVYSVANVYDYSNNTTARYIGTNGGSAGAYISNVNILKGVAKYTGNFYVSTAPAARTSSTVLLLDSTSAAIIDASGRNNMLTIGDTKISTAVEKYGTGSMSFDGTGDYVSVTNPLFALGTGDFTIEGWVYNTGSVANNGVFQLAATLLPSTISGLGLAFFGTSNTWTWLYNGTQTSFGTVPLTNTWYHFAMCRSGTSLRLFLNGVLLGTVTDSTNYTQTALALGAYYSSTSGMAGVIDDFRITKGVARYTANFTPPEAIPVS